MNYALIDLNYAIIIKICESLPIEDEIIFFWAPIQGICLLFTYNEMYKNEENKLYMPKKKKHQNNRQCALKHTTGIAYKNKNAL